MLVAVHVKIISKAIIMLRKEKKLMNTFEAVFAKLKSKKFGSYTYYFDKKGEGVAVIEHDGKLTYVIHDGNQGKKYILCTEIVQGKSSTCQVDPKHLYIVPDIHNRSDAVFLGVNGTGTEASGEHPESVFQVVNYGILDDEKFSGALLSGSKINVAVENAQCEVYQVGFIVGEGVRSCDGNPHGEVENAYHFTPIGTMVTDDVAYIQL